MKPLPSVIERFVKKQNTIPITDLLKPDAEPPFSPYGSYWFRAVAAMLRSGRVAAKSNDSPNLTDVNRICKEANFNQHFFDRIAKLLVAAKVVGVDRRNQYGEGVNHASFWNHRRKELTEILRAAVLQMIEDNTGYLAWRPTMAIHASLIEFLILFFTCFHGRALREDQLGQVMHDLCLLPESDLKKLGASAGLKTKDVSLHGWKHWLDEKGQKALLSALYTAEWAYYGKQQKIGWVMPSPMGLGILGLGPLPDTPTLVNELKADSNLAIFAGAGLDFDTLIPLFRCCKIKRIDQLFEFQVNPKRLKEMPSAGAELRTALANFDPLPSSMVVALQTESSLGGKIGIRYCSALVKPETADALTAIREHPQLKGYLEHGAPPGYLLVKPTSNPDNFIERCRTLGFDVGLL
ncbi:MAG: hypothetical protein EXS16_01960 [Gemmataceae bacterium]|nr:hypothetical protein [Gemmataceae bacterium]